MKEEPPTAPYPKPIPCGCCGDPIEYYLTTDIWREKGLGYVCAMCKYRISIAKNIMQMNGIWQCVESPEERGKNL